MQADASAGLSRAGLARTGSAVSRCELQLVFAANHHAVRLALKSVLGGLAGLSLRPAEIEALESALAEILNNVVEHAHDNRGDGHVEIRLAVDQAALACTVVDDGRAMPGDVLPPGRDNWDFGALATLPEGGFGWFLIRQHVDDLTYTRDSGFNRVSFRLPLNEAA